VKTETHWTTYVPFEKQQEVHKSRKRYKYLHCLPPGTLIAGCWKPIEEVYVGDMVISSSGTEQKVTDIHSRPYEGDLIEIKARYLAPIIVTPEHPILVTKFTRNDNYYAVAHGYRDKKTEWRRQETKWIPASELENCISDEWTQWSVKVPKVAGYGRVSEWSLRRDKYRRKNDVDVFPINASTAWVLGMYLAEGSSCQSNVRWSLGRDEEERAQNIVDVMENMGFRAAKYYQGSAIHVTVCSKRLAEVFSEKFGSGAANKRIPDDIFFHYEDALVASFLRGYSEGNGYFAVSKNSPNGVISYKTASQTLAYQVQLLVARFGGMGGLERYERKPSQIGGRNLTCNPFYTVRTTSRPFMSRLGLISDELQDTYRYFRICDDGIWTPVERVSRKPYSGIVYNLSTEDETFLVSNAVTHNCGARAGKDRCSINEYIKQFIDMLSETPEENPERDNLIPRVHGWIIAPTIPLAAQTWRELNTFMPKEWVVHVDENEKCMYTEDGGIIEVKSTSNPESLVAVGLDIVLWTEAARSKPYEKALEAWGNLFMRLQSPGRGPKGKGGLVLINSTPHLEGRFFQELYTIALADKQNWDVFHWKTSDNPYIRKEEEEFARKMMTADQFDMEWNGNFPKGGGETFPNLDKICVLEPEEPREGKRYYAAWDPATPFGEDDSIIGVRDQDGKLVWVEKVKDGKRRLWTDQHARVNAICRAYNNAPLVVLKTGVGEQSVEQLVALGLNVTPLHETPALKVDMVMHFSLLCEKEAIRLINDPFMVEQLRIYAPKMLPSGTITYSAPKHKHDDYVSMLLALYKNFQEPTSTIPFFGKILGVKRRG
jgi:hypothetical protein